LFLAEKEKTMPTRGRPPGKKSTGASSSQNHGGPKLLTAGEVAKHYRVVDGTVRRWVKGGSLEAVELPHRGKRTILRFTEAQIRAFDPKFEG
jgi:hypothetical protein